MVAAGVAVVGAAAFGAGVLAGGDDDGGDNTAPSTATAPAVEAVTVSSVPNGPVEEVEPEDPEVGTRSGSPIDDLPEDVTVLTDFGQRPDWSPDGSTLVFLDGSPLGHVWTVDVESGETRNLTEDLSDRPFSRAYYLSNGDLLLCGPTSGPEPDAEHPEAGRFTGVMSVLRAPFDEPPIPLGMPCWEGMATSRDSMQIAWNRSSIDYTAPDLVDNVTNGISEIWIGEIRDVDGLPAIVGARKVLDRHGFGTLAVFEVQGFRPPDNEEVIFTAYGYQGGEVFGLDVVTGALTNHSNSSAYEEAEGVDTEGATVLVERDLESTAIPGPLDIWRLDLDDGAWERLTTFNRYAPFYASNPAVAPDGSRFAFQLAIDGDSEGQGDGILLSDLPPD